MVENSQSPVRILLLEDRPDDVDLVMMQVESDGIDANFAVTSTREAFIEKLASHRPDIILVDYEVPGFGAPDALKLVVEEDIKIPVVVVAGSIGEETGVECMRNGAADYVLKQNLVRLGEAIRQVLSAAAVATREREARAQIKRQLRQQAEVAHIGQQGLTAGRIDQFLQMAAQRIADCLAIEFAVILDLDSGGNSFVLKAGTGLDEQLLGTFVEGDWTSAAGEAISAYETICVDHTKDDPDGALLPPLLRDRGIRHSVCVPIGRHQRPLGVLGLHSTEENVFSEDTVNFLRTAANVIGGSIERYFSEEELLEKAQLLDQSRDAIWVHDLEGRIRYWNNGAQKLFGWNKAEIIGALAQSMMFHNEPHRPLSVLRELEAEGEWTGEFLLRTKDGSSVWMDSHWTLTRDELGQPTSILTVNTPLEK